MSYLKELADIFAQEFLSHRVPLFHDDSITKWATKRTQAVFEEKAKALADNAADEFFTDPKYREWDYCYVTVIPKLEKGGISMKIYTESGLSMTGVTESATCGILSYLSAYRRKYERRDNPLALP